MLPYRCGVLLCTGLPQKHMGQVASPASPLGLSQTVALAGRHRGTLWFPLLRDSKIIIHLMYLKSGRSVNVS